MPNEPFQKYLSEINKAHLRPDATEHTHRPALKTLIEVLDNKVTATNEPRQIACGAPDILVSKRKRKFDFRIGYIECKDIGKDLKKEEKSEQIKKRYLPSLHNFILTDYINFRWYTDGELRLATTLAHEGEGGAFKATEARKEEVKALLRRFLEHEPEKVASAKELAKRMGHMARMLRDVTKRIFEQEEKTGPLHVHLAAFRKVLLPGLNKEEFADMYAQAIAYGLFAAWCHVERITVFGKDKYAGFHGMDSKGQRLTREHAAYLLPKTNPFLRKIFGQIVGPDLDDRLVWIVDDLVELLREAKMDSVLKGFGRKGGRSDPVVHFYETFLKEYDPKLRELRGVYYTPDEVVSYIVRSVDSLLKKQFAIKRGLADETKVKVGGEEIPKVLILDPAVGTGTFLFKVIQEIYKQFRRQEGAWAGYVKSQLLSRLFGFEFMMAPYAIAHTRLGLELSELGYDFESDERLGIYLTNTLEEAKKVSENYLMQGLSEEAAEANKVKKDLPIMVVLGNPPYSGHSANRSWEMEGKKKVPNFIGRLLKDYYQIDGEPLRERNPKWLQDDYVKFIRFGQWRIEETGVGILAFITNHSYLDNPTFRGMRQQLMSVFSEIYILDLHGNLKKKETCPDGSKDVNVFDIQQGVAIGIFVRGLDASGPAKVYHNDCWGLRRSKETRLVTEDVMLTEWIEIEPRAPFYLFKPQDVALLKTYREGMSFSEAMPTNTAGIVTGKDADAIGLKREEVVELTRRHELPEDVITPLLYRPFDLCYVVYHERVVTRPRRRVMGHMTAGTNVGLSVGRAGQVIGGEDWNIVLCTREITEFNLFRRGGNNVAPLYLYPGEGQADMDYQHWPRGRQGRVPNLSREFVEELGRRAKLEFVSDGRGDLKGTFGPEDIFHYIYAVFHSPEYRRRYAEFLKIDFPRVPWPPNKRLFGKLCGVGRQLVDLHLMEAEVLEDERKWPAFAIEGTDEVEKGYPKYVAKAQQAKKARVYINKEQYFEGVQPEVWEFHIGGYQVCEKWLKDRRGRKLQFDDIRHYQKIAVALAETIRLMKQPCLVEMFEG
jgi:type I restriction-modification system DNA methylase subunit